MGTLPTELQFTSADQVLALPSVPYSDRRLLPIEPGLYFAIVNGDQVAYIGASTTSLRGRWHEHNRRVQMERLGSISIACVPCSDLAVLAVAERRAIETLRPPLNTFHAAHPRPANPEPVIFEGQEFVTVQTAATELGVSHMTIRRWIEAGHLHPIRPGREYLILREELERYRDPKARPQPGRPRKPAAD